MPTLQKESVRKFMQLTAPISTNPLHEILGYVMYQSAGNVQTLKKTNLSAYCSYIIGQEQMQDVRLLLDATIINSLAVGEGDITFTIPREDGVIQATDGKFKQSFSMPPVDDYPAFPVHEMTEPVTLSPAITESIGIAATLLDEKLKTNFSYLHTATDDVFTTDNFVMYHKQFGPGMPKMVLSKEAAMTVGTLPACEHTTNGNIDFFSTDEVTYGFVKSEVISPAYIMKINTLKRTGAMYLSKVQVERFCEMTIGIHNSSDIPEATMEPHPQGILLHYHHAGLNKTNRVEVEAENPQVFANLVFDPRSVLKVLKRLPYERLGFIIEGNFCTIVTPEDEAYTGLLTGLNKI